MTSSRVRSRWPWRRPAEETAGAAEAVALDELVASPLSVWGASAREDEATADGALAPLLLAGADIFSTSPSPKLRQARLKSAGAR
jgi:hypothetical protein